MREDVTAFFLNILEIVFCRTYIHIFLFKSDTYKAQVLQNRYKIDPISQAMITDSIKAPFRTFGYSPLTYHRTDPLLINK